MPHDPSDLPHAEALSRHVEAALGILLTDLQRGIIAYRTGWTGQALTQTELAQLLGTSQNAVSKAEADLHRRLDAVVRSRAAEVERRRIAIHNASRTLNRAVEQMRRANR